MKKVFRFTFLDVVKKKEFFATTIGVALFLFVAGVVALGIVAYNQKPKTEEKKENKLKTVYVVNETEYKGIDFSAMTEPKVHMSDKTFDEVRKEIVESKEEDALVAISQSDSKENVIELSMVLPSDFSGEEEEGYEVLTKMEEVLLSPATPLFMSGNASEEPISMESLQVVLAPVEVEYATVGKEAMNDGASMLNIFGSMIIIMILYFMILVYGQSIAKTVSAEKTSKLMETLLLNLKPFDLIGGKVFAMALVGVLQFITWILGLVLGLVAGHYLGGVIYQDFSNPILDTFKSLREAGMTEAFSPISIVLAVIAFCLGFTFFCVFASVVASRISKAEDLGQGMGGYQVAVVISFFAAYFPLFDGKESLLAVVRWIPFTSAFLLPGDILTGNVKMWLGVMMLLVLFVAILVCTWFAGKMYRDKVFYRR